MSSRRHVAYQKNDINAGITIARYIDDLNKRKNQGAAAEQSFKVNTCKIEAQIKIVTIKGIVHIN